MKRKLPVFCVSRDDYSGMVAAMIDRGKLPKTHAEFIANIHRKARNLGLQDGDISVTDIPISFILDLIRAGKVKPDMQGRAEIAARWARQRDRLN